MTKFQGVKLVVADVDGTLLTHDKELTPGAQAAVRALRAKDIRFAITSGRPPRGMAMLVEPLELTEPLAGFNGGAYETPGMETLALHDLSRETAQVAFERMQRYGLDVWVYAGNDWFVRDRNAPHVEREAWTVKFGPTVRSDLTALLDHSVKLVGVSDDYDLVRKADSEVRMLLESRASTSRSQPYYLDVTHLLANKGAVVDWHAARLGIAHDAICTIGDGANDMLMFARSGHSIAMGNASEDVKKAAGAVTDSCDDDGFAKAMEQYLL